MLPGRDVPRYPAPASPRELDSKPIPAQLSPSLQATLGLRLVKGKGPFLLGFPLLMA